jgi:RND superfamily putative drug exporter
MGFGMAIGILLASFVVATLLVPAITTLAGKAAWWPARLVGRRGERAPAHRPVPEAAVTATQAH